MAGNILMLPDYGKPPVIEVVCGIMFQPLLQLTTPHLGLFWETFKSTYPSCKEVAPLSPVIESFDDKPSSPHFPLAMSGGIPPFLLPRIWFERLDERRLLQMQRDRFHLNWKKKEDTDEYPHYESVFSDFKNYLERFESFLSKNELGVIQPIQYEMSYVNHIPQGEGWSSLEDIHVVFPDIMWRANPDRFLSSFERLNWTYSFLLPERSGRLHITVTNGVRVQDKRQMLVANITARGMGKQQSREAMYDWFDLAHEWIVRGFTDITSEDVQRNVWKRIR